MNCNASKRPSFISSNITSIEPDHSDNKHFCAKSLNDEYHEISELMQELKSQVQTFVTTTGIIVESAFVPTSLATLFDTHRKILSEEAHDGKNFQHASNDNEKFKEDNKRKANSQLHVVGKEYKRATKSLTKSTPQGFYDQQKTPPTAKDDVEYFRIQIDESREKNDPLIFL